FSRRHKTRRGDGICQTSRRAFSTGREIASSMGEEHRGVEAGYNPLSRGWDRRNNGAFGWPSSCDGAGGHVGSSTHNGISDYRLFYFSRGSRATGSRCSLHRKTHSIAPAWLLLCSFAHCPASRRSRGARNKARSSIIVVAWNATEVSTPI